MKSGTYSVTFDPTAPSSLSFLADLMEVGETELITKHEVRVVATEREILAVTDLYPCVQKVEKAEKTQ